VNLAGLVRRPAFLPPFRDGGALRGARIGLTGQRGTLGALLAQRLQPQGIVVDGYAGDVSDEAALAAWIAALRPTLVFHLAAIVPVTRVQAEPVQAMRVNAFAPLGLVDALARHAPDAWLFHASTSHVYASPASGRVRRLAETAPCDPVSLYGATKLAGERVLAPLAAQFGVSTCIGRIFSYFHESQAPSFLVPGLVARIEAAAPGSVLDVADADSVRDLLYAGHVVDAILHLAARRHTGLLNIASGRGRTVGSLADALAAQAGKHLTVRHLPAARPTALVADVTRLRTALAAPVVDRA
jgi:nucleoside-diphosphate-sugar epimerase